MKALFLNPYLDTLGGGEKYMLDISFALHTLEYDTYVAWNDTTLKEKIMSRFGNKYSYINVYKEWNAYSPLKRLLNSRTFDVVFYQPDGSYPLSFAKKNFALLQVPNLNLVQPKSTLQRLKKKRWNPIFNSHFVKRFFIKNDHTMNGPVVYPAISDTFFSSPTKKKYIISVGRFFQHLHAKKQETLIKAYIFACEKYPQFNQYVLFLVGTSQPQDEHYVRYLRKISSPHPNIRIETNYTYQQLQKLYSEAQFYWHATGYGESEIKNPQKMEHFGISIVEAMASGAVVFAYKGGGPKETILHGKTGYLYSSRKQLIEYTHRCMDNSLLREKLSQKAVDRANDKFSQLALTKSISQLL
ncbi:MAG: glycosyltransferase family 4 protein [Candidatus Roizmanbacteria bacterium]|nr:glycosyltransferase family 4 protein [Candidatus Roizmanbacteria bacterium]